MPVDEELMRQATKRAPTIEPQKFAELMRAWRRRCKLSRPGGRVCAAFDGPANHRPNDLDAGDTTRSVAANAVCLTPNLRVEDHADALAFYQRLREANWGLGYDFIEGVLIKKADSRYPLQLRSATEEFRDWVKHRFLT